MDEAFFDHLLDQAGARLQEALHGGDAAFARHLARIRQGGGGLFEQRAPNGEWYTSLPGGFPYYNREVDALRARGDTITAENVFVRER